MSYATNYINDELQPNNSCPFYGSSTDIQNYTDYGAVIFQKCRDKFRELITGSNGDYQLNTTQDLTISEVETDVVMSIKDIVDKARDVFGLSVIQVASLVGVSRPSLYNHMSSKEMPKDISAYNDLYTLALAVESEVNINLKKGLKNVLVDGRTQETLWGHIYTRIPFPKNMKWVHEQNELELEGRHHEADHRTGGWTRPG